MPSEVEERNLFTAYGEFEFASADDSHLWLDITSPPRPLVKERELSFIESKFYKVLVDCIFNGEMGGMVIGGEKECIFQFSNSNRWGLLKMA